MAIYLATGDPDAKAEGDQIAVSFPSGSGVVEIALTPHQAMQLSVFVKRAVTGILDEAKHRPTGEVIAFPTKRVLSLAKRERDLNAVIRDFPDAFTATR